MTAPATAQQRVISAAPDSVSVTVYRDPDREFDRPLETGWTNGYALITETRTVTLPAGEVELRFEGVAGGIIPQSAIVTGLPGGAIEKNRDALLISPAAIFNAHLGRRVTLRRTDAATGAQREYDADILTDASGGMVVRTADGSVEALQCSGLNETLIYNEIPGNLSAKPVLSVRGRISAPVSATVTLSYLANGFDWQANYVASIAEDGKNMELFAWVTLANNDETSFSNAQTQAVAGEPNKEDDENTDFPRQVDIQLNCWPQGRTSDIGLQGAFQPDIPDRALTAPAYYDEEGAADNIIVTASRAAIVTEQEDLGDLKLYRIPVPVTVAANSLKQVAMFAKSRVKFAQFFRIDADLSDDEQDESMVLHYRMQNREKDGLGLPLPAGGVAVFRDWRGERILLGEGFIPDKALDEEVEIEVRQSDALRLSVSGTDRRYDDEGARELPRTITLTVANSSNEAANFEVDLAFDDERLRKSSHKLVRRGQGSRWQDRVAAHATRTLTLVVAPADDRE